MINEYSTIECGVNTQIEEKKSVFIATISPVSNETEAKEFINAVCVKYRDARHNVPAYRVIGENEQIIENYSDNGEPKGTAGMPILDILRGRNLVNICIVVTRYFGGTLLGTGGLVRAYGDSARAAIENSEILVKKKFDTYELSFDYTNLDKIKNRLKLKEVELGNINYTDKVSFTIYIEYGQSIQEIEKMISDETNNKYNLIIKEKNMFK